MVGKIEKAEQLEKSKNEKESADPLDEFMSDLKTGVTELSKWKKRKKEIIQERIQITKLMRVLKPIELPSLVMQSGPQSVGKTVKSDVLLLKPAIVFENSEPAENVPEEMSIAGVNPVKLSNVPGDPNISSESLEKPLISFQIPSKATISPEKPDSLSQNTGSSSKSSPSFSKGKHSYSV